MTPASKDSFMCPECGTDTWKIKDYDKTRQEYSELLTRFKRVKANHGVEEANWAIREIQLEQEMKYLQRKVRKQAEVITKLEDKLKKFKQQPYAREVSP